MAMVDIQSLFADIIESPRQRQQAMAEMGQREAQIATNALSGRSQIFAPLVGALARNQGARDEMLQRSVGGLFGLDTRNESEKLQQMLSSAQTPEQQAQLPNTLRQMGYGQQAMALEQQLAEQARALEDRELTRQAQQQTIAASQSGVAIEQAQEARTVNQIQRQQYNRDQLVKTLESSSIPENQKTAAQALITSGAFDNNPEALLTRLFPEADSPWQSAGGNGSRIFNKNTGEFLFAPASEEDQNYQDSFNTLIQSHTPQSVAEYFNAAEAATTPQERNAAIALLEKTPTGRAAASVEEEDRTRLELLGMLADTDRITGAVAGAIAVMDDHSPFFTAGAGPRIIRSLTGAVGDAFLLQPEVDLRTRIDQLKADIAFQRLAEMRIESPTGGALGNVSNVELGLLQSALGSLDTAQSVEQLREALENVQKHYVNALKAKLDIVPDVEWDNPAYRGVVRRIGSEIAVKKDLDDPNSWEIIVTQENPSNVR